MNQIDITEKKHWSQSKTLRFNALCAALIALEANLNLLQAYIPGNVYAWLAVGLVAGNSFLRTITNSGLTTQKADQDQ